jgi:transcriptional regulator with XRE-family HTH domain
MTEKDGGSPIPDADALGLASRLKEAREYLNLSQQFVAQQMVLSRSAISDIERGARKVDSLELKRFSTLYRLSVDHLLGVEDAELAGADPTATALARATKGMGDQDKRQLLKFAEFLRNFDGDRDASA